MNSETDNELKLGRKQVAITERAFDVLGELVSSDRQNGKMSSKGSILSELVLREANGTRKSN